MKYMQEKWHRSLLRATGAIGMVWLMGYSCFGQEHSYQIKEDKHAISVYTENYNIRIYREGFRYRLLDGQGKTLAMEHPTAGLQMDITQLDPIVKTVVQAKEKNQLVLRTITQQKIEADVKLLFFPHALKIQVEPLKKAHYNILLATAGIGPAYGMGDHAAFQHGKLGGTNVKSPQLINFTTDTLKGKRMASNFVIFPKQGLAAVNMAPGPKTVRITDKENLQGSLDVPAMPAYYYFFGEPKTIYRAFLEARNREGFPVYKPKYAWFGVGWEAFGALAWNTNQQSVTENVNQYLELGFPLKWMVVGSGFWPRDENEFDKHGTPYSSGTVSPEIKKLQATTSFGMWDKKMYPNPKVMIAHFHQKGLKFMLGLRITFIDGGPFTDEGLAKGYFVKDADGKAKLFHLQFPRSPAYLLDSHQANAVTWYVDLCKKWLDDGVDGFKEDLFSYHLSEPQDLLNPVNQALMDKGVYIMGRNNYLGTAMDLQRYEDFNYEQPQDRGPINGLAFAYSGFPNVYPDIIGGTGLATGRFGKESVAKLRVYLMRYAQYAALNPSMAFGYGPWNFDAQTMQVCLAAARLHDRLQPYIYSEAVHAFETGFPYPLTPLPLAFPQDTAVYSLDNTADHNYQWMMGESLLAIPIYGDNYAHANSRKIYLPAGTWIDYDNGKLFKGPLWLEDYPIPLGSSGLFVGGKGIVVEQVNGKLVARVYPVNERAEMTFFDQNGSRESRFSIENPNWKDIKVMDMSAGKALVGQWNRHAFEFEFTPGNHYKIY